MKQIILYGSKYGTAQRYAQALSEKTGIPAVHYEKAAGLDDCETLIYIGALYAGGVQGMGKTFKKRSDWDSKKIILATVGLADPMDPENTANIRNGMRNQLPKEVFERASIYHLRGGIDYSKLSFGHKTMMRLLYQKAKGLPEEQKTAEVRAMIDTYNQKVDFVDFSSLDPIIAEIQAGQAGSF